MKNTLRVLLALTALLAFGFLVGCANEVEDKDTIYEPTLHNGTFIGSGVGYRPNFPILLSVNIEDGVVKSYRVLAHNESTGTGYGYGLLLAGTPITASDHSPVGTNWPNLTTKFVGKSAPITVGTNTDIGYNDPPTNSSPKANTAAAALDAVAGATYSWSGIARAINDAYTTLGGPTGTATGHGDGYSSRSGGHAPASNRFEIEVEATFSGGTVTAYTITKHNESSGTGTGYTYAYPGGTAPLAPIDTAYANARTGIPNAFLSLLTKFNGRNLPLTVGPYTDIGTGKPNTVDAATDAVVGATYSWTGFSNAINDAYARSKY
jgi:hypothetical protein